MGTHRYGGGEDPGAPAGSGIDEPADARVGTVIANKYSVVRLLGRGGMGNVYEARDVRLNRRWAIKFLLPQFAEKGEILRRFENEATAAGGLEHPNLVAVIDFGYVDRAPYIVMEFLQGEDCSKLLQRVGPLPVPRAIDMVRQACRGLGLAHKHGIVHRDLKPENLFVTDAGDGTDLVKVLDFGIAKLRTPEVAAGTRTGETMGTAYYMSPEQARGARDVDERTDVWSLGIVLYELLSGRKPFEGETFLQVIHRILSVDPPQLDSLRGGLPRELVAIVEGCMAKDVTNRVPSVAALSEMLAPLSGRGAAEPIELASRVAAPVSNSTAASSADAPTPRLSESVVPWSGTAPGSTRARRRLATGAALAVGAIGIGVVLLKRGQERPTDQDPMASSAITSTADVVDLPKAPPTPQLNSIDPTSLPPEPLAPAPSAAKPVAKPRSSAHAEPTVARPAKPAQVPPVAPSVPPVAPLPINCDPPYTVLPNGQHKPKPQCL